MVVRPSLPSAGPIPALSTYSLRPRQCQLYFRRSSSQRTSLAFRNYGFLLVSSLCMLHQLFPTSTSSPLLQFTWSPIPESHLLKPSLPLLFLSPTPRIATILQIHSFFAILTSILTSSTLRAYHLNSLDVPNGFLTGSIRAVKYPPHHYQLHLSSTATTPTYFLIENFHGSQGPLAAP